MYINYLNSLVHFLMFHLTKQLLHLFFKPYLLIINVNLINLINFNEHDNLINNFHVKLLDLRYQLNLMENLIMNNFHLLRNFHYFY